MSAIETETNSDMVSLYMSAEIGSHTMPKFIINRDRLIFANLSINSKPISLKFCKRHFLVKS